MKGKQQQLFSIEPADPNVEWLLGALADGEWRSADLLCKQAGKPVTDYWRRWVRALAEASEGRVMSAPGSPGYKLTMCCTPKEITLAEAIRHQCQKMEARYVAIMKCWHKSPQAQQTP
jgi:hypothetical protein